MKKNNIILPIYCLCTFCSCNSCDSDSAEISARKIDKHENYKLGYGAYVKDRTKIKNFFEKIYDGQSDQHNFDNVFEEVLPETINQKNTNIIKDFFFVNNNIVLSGLFTSILQEKVFIDLTIEEVNNTTKRDELKNKLSTCLGIFENKIKTKLDEIDKNQNQILYDNVFEFNKLFNDEVLKKIIPDITEAMIKYNSIPESDIDEYKNKEWCFGISHILLSKLEMDSGQRNQNIQSKLQNLKTVNS